MKQFICLLALLGLSTTTTTTVLACDNTKSETIVNKPNLSTLFSIKQIVVGINDQDDLIIRKILNINKIDQVTFIKNATFKFLDHRTVLISVLETSNEWGGDDIKINLRDNLNTANFFPIVNADEANFDLSPKTIDVIKSKITTELDFTVLNIDLDYDHNVFRITPIADSKKYWGAIEIGYRPFPRKTLQSLISITDFTTTKNATKTDVLDQLSALNNNFIFDENQLEITDYNYQNDFTLTLTPKTDSEFYCGDSLTIIVRKNVNDLGLNGFAYNVDNDNVKTISQFKTSQTNLKVDWTALDVQKTSNTLTIAATATNQKYSGSFISVLWQPILFLDGYQADNKDKILKDLWHVNSLEIQNLKIDFEIDDSAEQLKVYDREHPEQNHITINYYERSNLATTITTTKLEGIYNSASESEIKAAIIAQNNLTPQQANAIRNQVDVYIDFENNNFYLKIKDYANISTVFYGFTANIAFDVQN
ncbi:hypothetical protein LD119_00120 [Mesoplasma sp. JKS002660]|uniref:hypothetical protein n=1 Tax=Mesoplasma whartonense TaxID=2878854 RepID=UPI002022A59F|nr:hypothetical protein [Mesoplasma sp. JKS002660]MCL8213194.1 hypothetical protein [Mesoplasma sp. JKS002660]